MSGWSRKSEPSMESASSRPPHKYATKKSRQPEPDVTRVQMLAEMCRWRCSTNTPPNNPSMGPDTGSKWEREPTLSDDGRRVLCASAYLQLGPLHLPLRPLHLEAGPLMPEEVEDPGDVVLSPGRLCSSLRSSRVRAA